MALTERLAMFIGSDEGLQGFWIEDSCRYQRSRPTVLNKRSFTDPSLNSFKMENKRAESAEIIN